MKDFLIYYKINVLLLPGYKARSDLANAKQNKKKTEIFLNSITWW